MSHRLASTNCGGDCWCGVHLHLILYLSRFGNYRVEVAKRLERVVLVFILVIIIVRCQV